VNPLIVIPTYVGAQRKSGSDNILTCYDHMTPLNSQGELPRCLASLRDVGVQSPICILVVSEDGVQQQATAKIQGYAEAMAESLDIRIIDHLQLELLRARMDELGLGSVADGIGLSSYGAIRNLGLAAAAAGGFSECIFIDDDEEVTDADFLERATYGLGKLTPSGIPVLVKTGYHTDRHGNWRSSQKPHWYNRYWPQGELFNSWMDAAMSGARLSRANTLYGGLVAIHREAFRRVSFDPWISRGEDLDYLLNLRMYGGGVWFDNQWSIIHQPPKDRDESLRFRQDIYRWIYEHDKLEFGKTQIDLLPIQASTLNPYPGPFLDNSIHRRVLFTALLRMLGRSQYRKGYFKAAMAARRDAKGYSESYCPRYYEFQLGWPQAVAALEADELMMDIVNACAVTSLSYCPVDGWPEDAPEGYAGAEADGAY